MQRLACLCKPVTLIVGKLMQKHEFKASLGYRILSLNCILKAEKVINELCGATLGPAYLHLHSLPSLQGVALWYVLSLLKFPCLRVLEHAILSTWNTFSSFLLFFPLDFGSKIIILQGGHPEA